MQKTTRRIHNKLRIIRILIALVVIIISSIGLLTGQHNFLPLSQFFLGAFMFLIAIEQIKKKDSGTGFICIVAGAFIWIVLIISYIK
jgi:predicted membrane channel-forming protein YqfA (hemolysin III family)